MIRNVIYLSILFALIYSCTLGQKVKNKKLDYDTLIEEGKLLAINNRIDSAIVLFNKAIEVDRKRVEAYYGLGFSYSQNCFRNHLDCEKSISYFNKSAEIDPSYRRIYYNRALCKNILLDYKSAIDDLDKQILLDDSDPDYFINRAGCKLSLKDTVGACEDYRRSVELGGTDGQRWMDSICK